MGEVWAGVRIADGLPVALKVLQTAAAARGEVVARFKREAQVLGRVRSDFVAAVIDFSSDPNYGLLLILQLIPGESLLAILNREKRIPLELALHVGLDIARGLHDLHEARIVHRDLKPGNVVLQPLGGGRFRAVLIDFGISRIVAAPEDEGEEVTAITRAGTVLGTLEYIAPEQIFGSQTVTGTADLYALGAIIYRAVAGQHAFVANADAALLVLKMTGDAPELPAEGDGPVQKRAKALVARLMARDPAARYQTAAEAAAEIQSILALAEDDGEFTTGIRGPAHNESEVEFGYADVVAASDLADAVDEDEEDETAAQISVDWEADIPVAVEVDEHTSDDEIQTIFRPGQVQLPRADASPRAMAPQQPQPLRKPVRPTSAQSSPQPVARSHQDHAAPRPQQAAPPAQQPFAAQPAQQPMQPYAAQQQPQPFPAQPTQQPMQSFAAQPAHPPAQQPFGQQVPYPSGAQHAGARPGGWQVQTLPPGQVANLAYPPAPQQQPQQVRPQSAVETMHISAYRPERPRWAVFVFVVATAALVGGVAAYLVLTRLLYPAH